MNTGKALETKRLVLVPGNNARDDEPFINMLRNDGNFRDFCGIEFSEKYLAEFRNYFERTGHIGYVGFHRERNLDYEIEFYISKSERRKGYCEEACKAVMDLFFSEGVSVDHTRISGRKLYATTLSDNRPVMQLLSKLGFTENIPEDGKALIMEGFVDEETDEFFGYCVAKYVLVREEGDSGDSTIS